MTIEEAAIGGLGAHVLTLASDEGLIDAGLKLRTMRLPDRFQDQDKPDKQYDEAGLNAAAHRRDGAEGAAPQQRRGGRGRAGLTPCIYRISSQQTSQSVMFTRRREGAKGVLGSGGPPCGMSRKSRRSRSNVGVRIHRELGPGLFESVYEAVMAAVLRREGLEVERQKPIPLEFDGMALGRRLSCRPARREARPHRDQVDRPASRRSTAGNC